jgi:hypothetical protein
LAKVKGVKMSSRTTKPCRSIAREVKGLLVISVVAEYSGQLGPIRLRF